jgi:flagellar motility protein MotE (MotC chaperone)
MKWWFLPGGEIPMKARLFKSILIVSLVLSTLVLVFRLGVFIKDAPFLSQLLKHEGSDDPNSTISQNDGKDNKASQSVVAEAYAQSTKTSKGKETTKDKNPAVDSTQSPAGSVSSELTSDNLSKNKPNTECAAFVGKIEQELKEKERALNEKEALLKALQKDIEGKLARLEEIQKNIEAFRKEQERLKNEKIDSLVKIYGTMKPKEASKLLEKLDDDLVVNIISRMTTEQAAKIIANMDVKKAAEISQKLSKVKNSGAQ